MSNVYPLKPDEKVLQQASMWFSKMERGLDAEETLNFEAWLAENAQNRATLLQMANLWDKMEVLNQLSDIVPHSPRTAKQPLSRTLAIAASLLIASVIAVTVTQGVLNNDVELFAQTVVSENLYSTKVGEQATFYLQDKTKVILNTNSKLRVTYTDKQRLFELMNGEFHVTVAHNDQQPLTVYAGGKIIQAVGTAFNVQLQDNDVELIVTDGKVLVADQSQQNSSPLQLKTVALPINSLAVSKGQKVELNQQRATQSSLQATDMDAELSWQQGNLVFRGESLATAMREVSRYTAFQFELADEQLKQVQIAGLFRADDIDGLLAALEQNFAIGHQRLSNQRILLQSIN